MSVPVSDSIVVHYQALRAGQSRLRNRRPAVVHLPRIDVVQDEEAKDRFHLARLDHDNPLRNVVLRPWLRRSASSDGRVFPVDERGELLPAPELRRQQQ